MTDPVHVPPPVFNFNAYSPAEIQEAVETVGVKKTNMPFLPSFTLAVVAGGAIGLGALYYTIVVSDPSLGFAAARLLGGLVFCLGLVIVLIGGAELFTGQRQSLHQRRHAQLDDCILRKPCRKRWSRRAGLPLASS